MIFIQWPFSHSLKCLDVRDDISCKDFLTKVSSLSGIPEDVLVVHNGCRRLLLNDFISAGSTAHLTFTLPGGKGGFGSMLRAIGAQIEKTTNREACRDLSGRRLRDINEEQRLKKWLAKKVEREQESERRYKARLQRLKEQPKHNFNDEEYNKQRSELPERIEDALVAGLKKKPKVTSRKHKASNADAGPSSKKAKLWGDLEIPSDTSDDEAKSVASSSSSSRETPMEETASGSSSDATSNDPEIIPVKLENESTSKEDDIISQAADVMSEESTPLSIEGSEDASAAENTKMEPTDGANSDSKPCDVNQPGSSSNFSDNSKRDLMTFDSVEALEQLGLEVLKSLLMDAGLKCGGTLAERAQRLWTIRGMEEKDYPANLKAKTKKSAKTAR